jgi:hypothetical protein
MQKETLTPQESLDLISSMIKQAKGNVKYNSFYFLLWGWAIVFVNLVIYLLLTFTDLSNGKANLAWLSLLPVVLIYFIRGYTQTKKSPIVTHLEAVVGWLWITYFATILIIMGIINFQINSLILIITALPTFVTGKALKFKPLVVGGVLFWCFGITSFFIPFNVQYLVSSVAYGIGYLVPGYLLKRVNEG